MEKSKSTLTKRVIIALASLLICLTIMGVAVYASLSQSLKLTNTISVTTDGQAKAQISAYEVSLAGNTAVEELPTEPTWGEAVITKTEDKDSEEKGLTPIIFSQTNNKNLYAYKIVVTNKSTVPVKVTITSSTESNTEIDVYSGKIFAEAVEVENTKGVNFQEANLAKDGELTYYIIVCANTDLVNMTATDTAQTFNIDVLVEV